MVFSSIVFICVFFPVVYLLHLILPSIPMKNAMLLIASLLFYAYGEPVYLFLLLASSLLNYVCALFVRKGEHRRKPVIVFAVIVNLAILGFYKYAGMAVASINQLVGTQFAVPEIPLPVGISFFTFQAMSYVIDVYRGTVTAQKNYGKVLLYISFFPQLIAGPIIKYRDISQYMDSRKVTAEKSAEGMCRFIVGLSKKVLIANTAGAAADHIFSAAYGEINITAAWIGALAYLLQIYYDFSGYSDMAIGIGKMFGFEIAENFYYPYSSRSIKEFWRRWHISLSSWFKEYLYIPLGGNRKGKWRTAWNKLIVFFCTGLWHGANWTFVIWGLYHGLFLTLEGIFTPEEKHGKPVEKHGNLPGKNKGILEKYGKSGKNAMIPAWLKHVYLLLVVTVGFVIFRADTMEQALWMIRQMFTGFTFSPEAVCLTMEQLTPVFCAAAVVGILGAFPLKEKLEDLLNRKLSMACRQMLSYGATWALLVLCIIHLSGSTYNPFIYFRF